MLIELRIKNFAIIDELELIFSKGLNVLTGETGAGKSIILNAVHLLMGGKATDELIRSSEEEGIVEALFDISGNREVMEKTKGNSHWSPVKGKENVLLIRRVLSRSGRGRAFIDGNLATFGMLSEIGGELLSIYGQHEQQSLQRVETHVDILDEFGGLLELREEFQKYYQQFVSLSEEAQKIREDNEKRVKEYDLMVFQSKEIETSGIQIGEEETLKEEKRILTYAQKLMGFANTSRETLYGEEGSAIERIQSILQQGREMIMIDSSLSTPLKNLENALIQLEEVALALRDYSRRIEVNPMRVEEIEARLELIDRLKKKYGPTVEGVLLYKERLDEILKSHITRGEKLSQLEVSLESLKREVVTLAERLSSNRKRVASELKISVEKELGFLGMKKTTFEVHIEETLLTRKGRDMVEFLVSPNLGEELKPLAKIASGGELSRMMLAMKRILAKVGGRQVLVFDEVDSGIGGAIAEVIGRKLRELSKHHQIICVTHLPQIACFADHHYSVKKEVRAGRTLTNVERLERQTIVDEIARMLGGVKVTEKTHAHAKEMIENAKKS